MMSTLTKTTSCPGAAGSGDTHADITVRRVQSDTGISISKTTMSVTPKVKETDAHESPYHEADDPKYERLSPSRKIVIVTLLSFCCFLSPTSSTTVLAALPEVAAQFQTSSSIIGLSNALYLLFMGISPTIWGPLCQVYGRRWICVINAGLFTCYSLGTALAPNLAAYLIFRMLTAIAGTSFLTVGSAIISDIYKPTERATAVGWFLSGITIGPAVGPFIGGVIVTYTSWRDIFFLQTALAGTAFICAVFLLPETIHYAKSVELASLPFKIKIYRVADMINPWRVLKLLRYPNLIATNLALASVLWNMYSLLTPIRYVLNPRFNLTSPTLSGLFYLAPGFGFLVGTIVGGRYADHTVRKWIQRRGFRLPEDRVRSAIVSQMVVLPGCMLIYGWCVEKGKGGIPIPVITMFIQGVAQSFCFSSVNTYCLDVKPDQSAEVIAASYMSRFFFAAAGTAVSIPAIESIGVGWFSTVSAGFVFFGALMLVCIIRWGKTWRDKVDSKKQMRCDIQGAAVIQHELNEKNKAAENDSKEDV